MKKIMSISLIFSVLIGSSLALLCFAQPGNIKGNEYIVGPGDILEITVWDHDDLARKIEVSREGAISFPFIGVINVMNNSVFDIEKKIQSELADGFLIAPQVNVIVSEYNNQKVFIFGEVKKPGSYVIQQKIQLLSLISDAGGFTDQRGQIALVVRPEVGGVNQQPMPLETANENEIIKIDLEKIFLQKNNFAQFNILPGDTVYIEKAEIFYVTGEVKSPGKFEWEKGLTVRQAVSLAGGGTSKAAINRIEIIRNKNHIEIKLKPDLVDPVLPNDIIKVPESYF